MKPLMYGYIRVASDAPDDEVDGIERQMRCFAEAEGFSYATTFYEYQNGSQAAFNELIQELRRAEARHVVMPSLEHLSSHRILCASMVERLETDADALVLTPGDT
ncbi:recombinase family protein [Streptomyces lunaelactis]|uniref:recombinase family protein n=1 Tax=Streptomyces lunaelactis TaxID=1535768 RepID=UPI00158497CB|nr:recombinase family protein [Streptomyces lunaelactis]NUL28425.1 recombinase family protein [Streptomyces lunaelactis]